MKKIVKILGGIFAVLLLLAAAVPYFLSFDSLKPKIIAAINEQTGKHVEINGGVGFSLLPIAGITVDDVAVFSSAADAGKKEAAIASLKSFSLNVDLMRLISHGEFQILSCTITEPTLALHVDKKGNKNWELVAKPASKETQSDASSAQAAQGLTFSLHSLKVENANISFNDEQAGSTWNVQGLNLSLTTPSDNVPSELKADTTINGEKLSLAMTISTLSSLLESNSYDVDMTLKSDLVGAAFKGRANGISLKGNMKLDIPSAKTLAAWASPQAEPIGVATKLAFALEGAVEISPDFLDLNNASIKLDDNMLAGNLRFTPAHGITPLSLSGQLSTSELNLTPYMPAEAEKKADARDSFSLISAAIAQGAASWSDAVIDYEPLKQFEGDLMLQFGKISAGKIELGKGTLQTEAKLGNVNLLLMETQMFGGKGSAELRLTAMGKGFRVISSLKEVQAEQLLTALADYSDLSGTANVDIMLKAQGSSERELLSNLSGDGKIKVLDGALKGYNVAEMVRNIKGAFKPVHSGTQKTDFAELSGSFVADKGIISNTDLSMKAPFLRLGGKGDVNLPNRTINYRLLPEIVQTSQGQGGKEKTGVVVPLIISGSMDAPTITPDVKSVVKDVLKDPAKAKEQLKNAKEAIKSPEVKDTIKNLKGLLR